MSSTEYWNPQTFRNDVDSWIDELDVDRNSNPLNVMTGSKDGTINQSILMASLMQQHLPQVEIPHFKGEAIQWVEFVVKFRDVVHDQPYLSDRQRNQLLMQHLRGEAKRAVQEYVNDPRGYPLSLKKLKYLFGQRPTVAKAVLSKVTKGKPVSNRDTKGLADLYYSICDCLITLKQLNYMSDLNSSDTLDQAVRRLPQGLCMKWAERSLSICKQHEEPNLRHLEQWLKDRVLAQREVYPVYESNSREDNKFRRKGQTTDESHIGVSLEEGKCDVCKQEGHNFWKCRKYKILKPDERMELVIKLKRCFNCFSHEHVVSDCSSKYSCFESECKRKHHTTLHQYFSERAEARKLKRKQKKKESKDGKGDEEVAEKDEEVDASLTGMNVVSVKSEDEASTDAAEVTIGASMNSKSVVLMIVAVTIHIDGVSWILTPCLMTEARAPWYEIPSSKNLVFQEKISSSMKIPSKTKLCAL